MKIFRGAIYTSFLGRGFDFNGPQIIDSLVGYCLGVECGTLSNIIGQKKKSNII